MRGGAAAVVGQVEQAVSEERVGACMRESARSKGEGYETGSRSKGEGCERECEMERDEAPEGGASEGARCSVGRGRHGSNELHDLHLFRRRLSLESRQSGQRGKMLPLPCSLPPSPPCTRGPAAVAAPARPAAGTRSAAAPTVASMSPRERRRGSCAAQRRCGRKGGSPAANQQRGGARAAARKPTARRHLQQ